MRFEGDVHQTLYLCMGEPRASRCKGEARNEFFIILKLEPLMKHV